MTLALGSLQGAAKVGHHMLPCLSFLGQHHTYPDVTGISVNNELLLCIRVGQDRSFGECSAQLVEGSGTGTVQWASDSCEASDKPSVV